MSNVATQEDAIALMLTFKPAQFRSAMAAIVQKGLDGSPIWPDEVDFSKVPEDSRNAIGNSFKVLSRAGIIEQVSDWRKSKAEGQKGRRMFAWRIASVTLGETFLRRNGEVPVKGQMQLL